MKIKFLGTGAAEGIPAMFCNCEVCKSLSQLPRKYKRTRSQIVVDDCLGIDFPPEAYAHAVEFGVDLSAISNLLVSHSHMDHFYAHDFILRGYKYSYNLTSPELNIWGNSEVSAVFAECTRRELKPVVAELIKTHVVEPFTELFIGGYRVLTLPSKHSATEQAMLYYIEKDGKGYLNLFDSSWVNDAVYDYLKDKKAKVHLVVMDCTYLDTPIDQNARHMNIIANMEVREKLTKFGLANEETKYIITHFSHNANPNPQKLQMIESKYGVIAAFDGMEICI